jgi:hypothetical protein
MKNSISIAKKLFNKVTIEVECRLQIACAVMIYTVADARLRRLHPVRDQRKYEAVGYKVRSSRVAFELACEKLDTL